VIDEGDFRLPDECAEIVKILNNGNAKDFPVLRSEATARAASSTPSFGFLEVRLQSVL
jgi:hypothetical protein